MLILSRREGQSIVIGSATVRILSLTRGRVKLGIDAPVDVVIARTELVDDDKRMETIQSITQNLEVKR